MAPKPAATHPNVDAFPSGMSGPALRALAHAGIRSLTQVAKRTERELATLHGMGPKALRILSAGLTAHGLQFRRD